MAPRQCAQCGDVNGPFVRLPGGVWVCEPHAEGEDDE